MKGDLKMRKDKIIGKLPDPFIFFDGTRVQSITDWERRRKEILDKTVELEYGGMPPAPDAVRVERLTERGMGSTNCYRVHCLIGEKDFTFCFTAYRPAKGYVCPVVVTGDAMYNTNCNDQVIEEANRRGFVVVKFNRTEFVPDIVTAKREDGIYPFWPDKKFTAISAWAWGYHRVVDALFDLDYIDTDNIAITGHSRGGKTVILAGATDDRIRFVNPNSSGTHGCGCYRFVQVEEESVYVNQVYQGRKSEELKFMFDNVPHWMGEGLKEYIHKEDQLPHDMHFIKALVAPRILLETNGYADIWCNPRGSYQTFLAAKEVWKMYGNEEDCQTWYEEREHRHTMPEFKVLFDLMDARIYQKGQFQSMIPYDDMEPLYDWSADGITP